MTDGFGALEVELRLALGRRIDARRRRTRRLRAAAVAAICAGAFSAVAIGSGIVGDLQLDPSQWTILGRGGVDGGKGEYIHARHAGDQGPSTFLVEHDAGLAPYQAFLLHERTLSAASSTSPAAVADEPGDLCSPAALTRAETVALATLRAGFTAGADPDATRGEVDHSVQAAFAAAPCRGLAYAGEQARFVFAGVQPESTLMPGARSQAGFDTVAGG